MDRGSPICERGCKKIVEYFKNNVPQCQIAKALQISSSIVHNIIKRFRETGAVSSGLKRRETFQCVVSVQFKSSISDDMGVHKCIQYGQLVCFGRHYECWKVSKGFRATYAPLQTSSISGKALCISAGQCKTTYCSYYNSMASSRRVRVLNWPVCSPDLSPIENIWSINKRKIRQRRPQTLQQLEIRQEWDQIPTTPETHNLDAQTSSSGFEKKRRCYTMVNMPPSQLFWDL